MESRRYILEELRKNAAPSLHLKLPRIDAKALFKDFPKEGEGLSKLYKERATPLSIECHIVNSMPSASEILDNISKEVPSARKISMPSQFLTDVCKHSKDFAKNLETLSLSDIDKHDLSKVEISLTTCHALVARTASVIVRTDETNSRMITALPTTHIVLAKSSQIVLTLQDAFDNLSNSAASIVSVINGPSRTADIEKILVLGAHGPKRLVVIILEDN